MLNHSETKMKAVPPRKKIQIVIAALALAAALCGATLAYLSTPTLPLTSTFIGAKVSSEVKESFDGTTKSNVTIRNTGNIQSYIRAALVVTWVSDDGVFAAVPMAGTDYTMTFAQNTGWEKGPDGFWYYTRPVNPGADTEVLISSCTLAGTAPEGCRLSVEIVASSVQSLPVTTVASVWSSGISGVNNGTLVVKEG